MQKRIRVAGYLRVSTEEQAEEGYSIQAQEEVIRKACEIQGKEVVKVYADKGISGKSTNDRLALKELMEDSKKGLFDEVMVWKTSRLARNMLDLLQIVNELEKNNVMFRSLSEAFDTTTSQGKLMMNLLGSISEFERTTIIENLRLGMNARARQGYKNGGRLLGYRSEGRGKESRLVIIPEEAEVVKIIYRMYIEGNGYKAIVSHLNRLGFRTAKGNPFCVNGVRDILCNPTYAGMIRHNRYIDYSTKRRAGSNEDYILAEGRHEAIIDRESWDKVRLIMEKKSGRYSLENKGKFPLTGILRCPECGAGMVAANTVNTLKDGTKRRIRYYSCGNFKNKGSSVCSANSVRADYAEEYVFKKIQEVLLNEKVLKDTVNKLNRERKEKISPLNEKKDAITKKLKAAKEKKDRVFELYEDGTINKETLGQRLKGLDEQVEEQLKELENIENDLNNLSKDEVPYEVVRDVMRDFNRLIQKAEPLQKKLFLQMMVEKITVTRGKVNEIHIHFNQAIRKLISLYTDSDGELPDDGSSPYYFNFEIAI